VDAQTPDVSFHCGWTQVYVHDLMSLSGLLACIRRTWVVNVDALRRKGTPRLKCVRWAFVAAGLRCTSMIVMCLSRLLAYKRRTWVVNMAGLKGTSIMAMCLSSKKVY
jgi:hypothetical protein